MVVALDGYERRRTIEQPEVPEEPAAGFQRVNRTPIDTNKNDVLETIELSHGGSWRKLPGVM